MLLYIRQCVMKSLLRYYEARTHAFFQPMHLRLLRYPFCIALEERRVFFEWNERNIWRMI